MEVNAAFMMEVFEELYEEQINLHDEMVYRAPLEHFSNLLIISSQASHLKCLRLKALIVFCGSSVV